MTKGNLLALCHAYHYTLFLCSLLHIKKLEEIRGQIVVEREISGMGGVWRDQSTGIL
jgi:hypothetical protein